VAAWQRMMSFYKSSICTGSLSSLRCAFLQASWFTLSSQGSQGAPPQGVAALAAACLAGGAAFHLYIICTTALLHLTERPCCTAQLFFRHDKTLFSARRAWRTWCRLRSPLWLHQEEAQLMCP